MSLSKENLRAYVFIEFKRGQTATEIYQQLCEAGIDPTPSRTTVFEWFRRFKEGRDSLSDNPRSGRPISLTTETMIGKVKSLIDEDPRRSLRMLAADLEISKDCVKNILTVNLGLRKVCSRWVPYILTPANKQARVECAQNMVNMFERNSLEDCCQFWCSEDETWALYDTPNTKAQNMAWLSPGQPKLTVAKPKLTNRKAMLLVAFTSDKKISIDSVDPGTTVDADRYIEFVQKTGERWRKLKSRPTRLSSLWWQQDNARCHVAAKTLSFFERRNVFLIKQAPYSPDLNQCDRWINRLLKQAFREAKFSSGEEIVQYSLNVLNQVSEERFINEMKHLIDYCRRVIACGGEYCI